MSHLVMSYGMQSFSKAFLQLQTHTHNTTEYYFSHFVVGVLFFTPSHTDLCITETCLNILQTDSIRCYSLSISTVSLSHFKIKANNLQQEQRENEKKHECVLVTGLNLFAMLQEIQKHAPLLQFSTENHMIVGEKRCIESLLCGNDDVEITED